MGATNYLLYLLFINFLMLGVPYIIFLRKVGVPIHKGAVNSKGCNKMPLILNEEKIPESPPAIAQSVSDNVSDLQWVVGPPSLDWYRKDPLTAFSLGLGLQGVWHREASLRQSPRSWLVY